MPQFNLGFSVYQSKVDIEEFIVLRCPNTFPWDNPFCKTRRHLQLSALYILAMRLLPWTPTVWSALPSCPIFPLWILARNPTHSDFLFSHWDHCSQCENGWEIHIFSHAAPFVLSLKSMRLVAHCIQCENERGMHRGWNASPIPAKGLSFSKGSRCGGHIWLPSSIFSYATQFISFSESNDRPNLTYFIDKENPRNNLVNRGVFCLQIN